MRDHGIGSWPARRARMSPERIALVEGEREVTYGELDRRVCAVAQGLSAAGIRPGDRVAYLGLNSIAYVEAMFATPSLGGVFFPVNARLAGPELVYVLDNSDASLVVTQPGFSAPETYTGAHVTLEDSGEWPAGFLGEQTDRVDMPVGADDLFMLQYTSGTSGRPKGVMLTHGNILTNVMNLLVDVDMGSAEVALVTAPLFHTAALNQLLLPTFLKGGTALIESRFDPAQALDAIENRGVTTLFGVTSMYQSLAAQPRFAEADLSGLRHALCGGAPIPETLLHTYLDRGIEIIQGYGLTESSPGATMLRAGEGARKLGSAGTPCFFTDLRLIRPDGTPAAVGEPGEVLVEGPNVSPGYWHNPEATAASFDDGWLHTGDVAIRDDEGYIRIVDRVKDMYISGGENVYPAEVEQAIYTHPVVAECAVIGVPDEKWGEAGMAFIRVHDGRNLTHEELIAHLDGRIARYKLPRETVIVAELPHNPTGKLVRSRVKEMAIPVTQRATAATAGRMTRS